MKKSKKYLSILVLLFVTIFTFGGSFLYSSLSVQPATSADSIKDENVQYDSVEKIIKINENKVCDITEIITVTYLFDNINVGLSRNISRANKITRIVNGKEYVTKTINKLELVSLTMDDLPEYHFVEEEGDYYYINTGKDYDYKVGQHVYKINYLYDMGEDFINDFDDFTFDIMDYGFRSAVSKFSASITLPSDFLNGEDIDSVLSFRTNNMQALSSNTVHMQYDPDTYTISCSYNGKIGAKRGITMQLILPEDYFDTSFTPSGFYYFVFIFSIISLIAIPLILFFSRYVKKGVITPEFYPPKNFSPMDVAWCYRGDINKKDFASLIIHWASLGLIRIETKNSNHIILHKLKDYPFDTNEGLDGSKEYEKDYFDALFKNRSIFDTRKQKYKYDASLSSAIKVLYHKPPEKTKKLSLLRLAIHLLAILPILFFSIWGSAFSDIPIFVMVFISLFPIIAVMVFTYASIPLWFKLVWCGGFGGIPLGMIVVNFNVSYDIFSVIWIVLVLFLLGNYSAKFVRVFTKEEKSYRDKILGFRNFIVKAEVQKLEMLIAEDPEYYYNILPYCYVLGITRKMEKKFKALHMAEPEYLNGVTYVAFCHTLSHSMGSAGGRSSSGGGGSGGGGGGSSGGGGGGGGCGGR